ncbi:MAG TPA: Gfo/Idh/MocA family oxidoreductase [Actinomycetota bacterium]|nr:Gfo/Idh/MocA family oxidoreductase [Actinomycetota bacterium]
MSSAPRPLRWGILGTGKIARVVARALARSRTGELVAVGSRSPERSRAFADEFALRGSRGGYEAVIEDPGVDIVYVATNHPSHREWATRAADAGKHLLCEKPLAVNRADAEAIVDAARRNDVFLLEAFAYRCHPQTRRLLEVLRSGAIGQVKVIDAAFGYDAGPNPGNYLLVHELAGGSILDVGCYPTSMAHLIARVTSGAVTEPADVFGVAEIGPEGVDHYASAVLRFDGGPMARVACSIQVDLESSLRIFGSRGRITVPSPWLPSRIGAKAEIVVQRAGSKNEIERIELDADEYRIEVDAVSEMVRAGERSPAVMPWEESLANMATLDRWRASAGVRYEQDEVVAAGAGRAAPGR